MAQQILIQSANSRYLKQATVSLKSLINTLKSREHRTFPGGTPKVRKNSRNTDLRFPVRQVTAKRVYIATRNSKSSKLMKKQRIWENVEYITQIKVSSISLSLRANYRGDKIDKSYQIGGGRSRFTEAVLIRVHFKSQIMRNMVMSNKLK